MRPTPVLRQSVLTQTALGASALLIGVAGGVYAEQQVNAPPEEPLRAIDPAPALVQGDCPPGAAEPPYPVNENGMTYGSGALDQDGPGPDLIAAHGIDGDCGYVRAEDRAAGGTVPLYAEDGVTVVGTAHLD